MGLSLVPVANFLETARMTQARLVTASSSLQTVINVTGRGFASVGICSANSVADFQGRIVLTVDGVVISDVSSPSLAVRNHSGMYVYGAGNISSFDAVNTPPVGAYALVFPAGGNHNCNNLASSGGIVGFRQSLHVQVSTTSANNILGLAVVTTFWL